MTASQFRPWASKIWALERWERGAPSPSVLRAFHRKLRCAAGPGHRTAMLTTWRADRRRFFHHRGAQLAELNIDHRWAAHWAPDWSGPTLPPYEIAALAEEAGKVVGVDVPGWTMEQVTEGESTRRPGSAAVDVGGTVGWGLWAITDPFANALLAKHGWTYEDMLDPVPNAIIMAEMYGERGIAPWYGIRFVTCWSCHYRGRFDLRLVLGGKTLRQAMR